MRSVVIINTGTEILLGDVVNAHLAFIAREIFEFGLRVEEQRTISDGVAIEVALRDVFPRAEILFVTGGLGPTSDDVTREIVTELLQLDLVEDTTYPHDLADLCDRPDRDRVRFTARPWIVHHPCRERRARRKWRR